MVRLPALIKQHIIPLVLIALSFISFITGIILFVAVKSNTQTPIPEQIVIKKKNIERSRIYIDVSGAVVSPGVYALNANDRIIDALIAAGGLNQNANHYFVAKNINLAKKITDEQKIYIPFQEEQYQTQPLELINKKTNINTASKSELELLPKIGAVRAQKIIDNRPYSSLYELISKKIIGEKTYFSIESLISL